MRYTTATYTSAGGREYNEDSVYLDNADGRLIAIVADGLGMHGGGAEASLAAVNVLSEALRARFCLERAYLLDCFERANQAVLSQQEPAKKMKTTAVLLAASGGAAALAHAGDSRGYYFSGGTIAFQTTDHSVSQLAVARGDITPDGIRFHEDRNRILRALGGDATIKPDIKLLDAALREGDAFLLCSDGFWEYVNEPEMEADLAVARSVDDWLHKMRARIAKRVDGKNDNLSAIAIWCVKR